MSAAYNGHLDCVKWFVEEGKADINLTNKCGNTAIDYGSTTEIGTEIRACLTSNGAKMGERLKEEKEEGRSSSRERVCVTLRRRGRLKLSKR